MNEPVRDWYLRRFPLDEVGRDIKRNVTFGDIMELALDEEKCYEIDEIIGVLDSEVRWRVVWKAKQLKNDARRVTSLETAMILTGITFEWIIEKELEETIRKERKDPINSCYYECQEENLLKYKIERAQKLFDLNFFYSKKLQKWVLVLKNLIDTAIPERIACEVKDKDFWAEHYREIAY